MARREIKSVGGQLVAYYKTEGSRDYIYTRSGERLGWYDREQDVTKDRGGKLIGRGDLTATLLCEE